MVAPHYVIEAKISSIYIYIYFGVIKLVLNDTLCERTLCETSVIELVLNATLCERTLCERTLCETSVRDAPGTESNSYLPITPLQNDTCT